jgi:hypothetical protein
VFTDELLGPAFLDSAEVDLEVHLPVMCDFWQTGSHPIGRGTFHHPDHLPRSELP